MKKIIALLFSMFLFFGAVPGIAAACSDGGCDEEGDDGPGWLKPGQEWPAKQNTKALEKGMGAGEGQGCEDGVSGEKGGNGNGGTGGRRGRG